ncbi:MAG: hypothetical protein Q9166_003375 [cf. Caloplaca sp. 2 TL-2023]
MPDNATARKVCLEYTMAAAKEFTSTCIATAAAAAGKSQIFRFVYLSGGAAERDQTKASWFKQDYRRIRGQVENELLAHTKAYHDSFETFIFRPGLVLAKETSLRDMVRGLGPSIRVDKLAGAMIEKGLSGGETQIIENREIGV